MCLTLRNEKTLCALFHFIFSLSLLVMSKLWFHIPKVTWLKWQHQDSKRMGTGKEFLKILLSCVPIRPEDGQNII